MDTRAVFSASLDQLHPILEWIQGRLQPIGLEAKTIRKIELASEEAIVNIILHGYKEGFGTITVEIKHQAHPEGVFIIFRDHAPPFNPLERDIALELGAPLEERELGGLGIFLMRQYMDDVEYRREGNANILTLSVLLK